MRKVFALLPIAFGLFVTHHGLAAPLIADDGKDVKATKQTVTEESCFKDHEFQVDIFGQYAVGEGPHQAGVMRDHGWGGGLGLNYFFFRNVGIGVDGAWMDVKESPAFSQHRRFRDQDTALNSFSGNLILRLPLDHPCIAPYMYAGGGYLGDGLNWGSGDVGVGVEFRIKPQRLGIFLDQRWTYLGDRDGHRDLNFFSSRIGVRIIF